MRQWIVVLMVMFLAGSVGAETGVTDDKIKVGMIADLTGPIAFVGQEASSGVKLYLQHVNDLGGVHGRKIELIVEDDGYKPPRTVAAFRKLLDRDGVFCFAGNIGSSTTMATFPLIKRERVPLIGPGNFNSAMFTPAKRYVFALDPSYPTQSWIMLKYIHQNAPAAKLAIIYQDDDMGLDGLRGFHEAAKHYNLPVVAEASYKRGAVDFSTQVLSLKQKDPTHVILVTVTREAPAILEKSHQLGWHPQFLAALPAADQRVVELAGEAAANFMGITFLDLSSPEPDKQTQRYLDLVHQYDPGRKLSLYHAYGVMLAQIFVEGLQRAGRDLTREKLVDAMETFNGWQDCLGPPVTYGPNVRGGSNTAAFLVKADVKNKTLVRATDWIQFEKPQKIAKNGK
ncbi:MAG: ABC transporter substrate-binding protein [Candidatus Latescibacteria bacterium]|jgi:branched-chain amino acid transport system substrate-binding protein|nr:ABC transporter substrate-binding protein [Candidatus Latescibacterota bacterium]